MNPSAAGTDADHRGADDVPPAPASIRVGVGGWNYPPWRASFYPPDLVQRRELEYASRRFDAIEVNSTFYRAQQPATYARWAAQTPAGFVFTLKAPRYVTQSGPLREAAGAANRFVSGGLAELGSRLGPILWQLAPSRRFDADDLAPFLDALPRTLDGQRLHHAFEVRHASFCDPAYLALARRNRIATVFTDAEQYPSLADLTAGFVYARLMRSQDDLDTGYPADALDRWAQHAREWAAGGDPAALAHVGDRGAAEATPRDVFVFFISGAKRRNPAAALALIERLHAG